MPTHEQTLELPVTELNRLYRRTRLPRPYPDPEAYQSNLKAALASDPRKKTNYEKYKAAKKTVTPDYLPIKLDIENVSRCNFRCTMCQVSDWGPFYKRASDMPLEHFKALIDEQYGLVEIKVQGMGEPLLQRDTFFEMVKYARSKHIWVRTTTNASLLHHRENYRKLIDSGICEVQISFDGANKESFESIRIGSKFELVYENCKLINRYCNDLGLLKTRMWAVVQQGNVREFPRFVERAAEMGFKRMTYSLSLTDWGQVKWAKANAAVTAEDMVTPELAHAAIERGKQLGVEVTFWDVTSKYSTDRPDHLCAWPFERAFVSSDMRVVPCCIIANPDVAELGRGVEFTKVWQSDQYQEFRRAHLEGRIPKVCEMCYLSPAKREQPEAQAGGPRDRASVASAVRSSEFD